jgi:signal transduction histidine kinase
VELGGTCEIERVATGGTRVRVELPCFLGPET